MKLFEILLVLLAAPAVLRPVLPSGRRPGWMDTLAVVVLGLGAVNYLLEILTGGSAFRMFPIYLLILAAGIPALVRIIRKDQGAVRPRTPVGKVATGFGVTLGILWLVLSLALPLLIPMNKIAATGPYAVGTVTYEWIDDQRPELYNDVPDDFRKLAVQFWYPTDGKTSQLSSQDPSYPVVIFSHGATGIRSSNTSTYMELASNGYVVASIDHAYLNLFTRFSDGQMAMISQRYLNALNSSLNGDPSGQQEMMSMYGERVADMRFTIDQIEVINQNGTAELPANRLDLARIGLFGHSAGATTAAETCRQDDRCQAALLIDGTLVFDIIQEQPDGEMVLTDQPFPRPMMQVNSGVLYDMPRYQDGYAPNRAAFKNATLPSYNLVFDQASHMNLTDLPLLLARPVFELFSNPQMKTGPIDPKVCTQTLNAYTLAFFDKYLKGQSSSLLDGPSPDYSFVRYEYNP